MSSGGVMSSSTDMLLTRLGFGAEFPVGLRVMAIDPDFVSLNILNAFLLQCNFTVLVEVSAKNALERVYVGKEECDIVVTELDNLDVDAFVFLEQMCKRVPVVVLSNLDDKTMIMKAILIGVVDYMLKPSTLEMMRNIWQHVVKSRLTYRGIQLTNNEIYAWRNPSSNPNPESSSNPNPNSSPTLLLEGGTSEKQPVDEICQYPHLAENTTNSEKKDGNDDDGNYIDNEDSNSIKKTRVTWDDELHQRFITAVDQLCGPDVAKPKQILELMNIPWLSRENVASHLQKYRLAMKNQLKVRPIWMDSNKTGSVANSQMAGFPFLQTSFNSVDATREQHPLLYPQSYDHLAPIIEPQYNFDEMFDNIPNQLFTNHYSQDFHVQQPPMAPTGGNFNKNINVINSPAAPM